MNGAVCFVGLTEKTGPLSDVREFYVFFFNLETSGVEANVQFKILKACFVSFFLSQCLVKMFSLTNYLLVSKRV